MGPRPERAEPSRQSPRLITHDGLPPSGAPSLFLSPPPTPGGQAAHEARGAGSRRRQRGSLVIEAISGQPLPHPPGSLTRETRSRARPISGRTRSPEAPQEGGSPSIIREGLRRGYLEEEIPLPRAGRGLASIHGSSLPSRPTPAPRPPGWARGLRSAGRSTPRPLHPRHGGA